MGTVVLNVFKDPPLGSQRFLQLAKRSAGGYRLSKIDGISDVSPLVCLNCKHSLYDLLIILADRQV